MEAQMVHVHHAEHGFHEQEGKVMVCTATDCKWNDATKCFADAGIMVNFHQDHADCNTYTLNEHIPGQMGSAQL